jgi:hypothetical protein
MHRQRPKTFAEFVESNESERYVDIARDSGPACSLFAIAGTYSLLQG